jgi:hypothetical protein
MRTVFIAALVVVACGGEESEPQAAGGSGASPEGAGAVLPCPAGELLLDDGGCAAAGVPEDGCGSGFVHDDATCAAPVPTCGPGSYAFVGERSCRVLGTPAAGKWGDIVVAGDTQYVDGAFSGANNGSASAPWTTIQQAVAAAADGAVVAVAAGTYVEAVFIDRPITLWGIGAAAVSIDGGASPAIYVNGATAEVRGVSLTGAMGANVVNATDVVLRDVRVHDCAGRGIVVFPDASVSVESSLVESVTDLGIAAQGGDVTLVDSVIRDVAPLATGEWGAGLVAWSSLVSTQSIVVRRSIVERTYSFGISVHDGVDTLVEDTLVRDVEVTPVNGDNGTGLAQSWPDNTETRASLTVRRSVFERLHQQGVVLHGGDATIERVTVRDCVPPNTEDEWGAGIGIMAIDEAGRAPSHAIVRESTVDDAHRVGVELWGGVADLERVLVRRPRMKSNGQHGFGVLASSQPNSGLSSGLTWRGGRIEDAHQGGLTIMGSPATIESVAVVNTHPDEHGALGVGIAVLTDYITTIRASAEMTHVVVDGAHAGGIVVGGADLTLSDAVVRNIQKQPNVNDFGDGIGAAATIVWLPGYLPTTLTLTRATIESVPRAGISNFGATVSLRDTLLECNAIQLDGEPIEGNPFHFSDEGNNDCGCADSREPCKVLTTNIQPPLSF